jgi:hypothetical protein
MNEVATTRTQAPLVAGEVIQPTAYAGPKAVATHKLGELLKELVHGNPHAFTSENQKLEALNTVDGYVKAHTQPSEIRALSDGTQRAPIEDVTQRKAPNVGYSVPTAQAAPIDYDRLAAAIVRAQAAQQTARTGSHYGYGG